MSFVPQSSLTDSANRLRSQGLTPIRAFRVLKRRFPKTETEVLWGAVGKGRTGINPLWTYHNSINPVTVRRDPRQFPQ